MEIKKGISNIPKFFRPYLKKFLDFFKERLRDNLISIIIYGSVARGTWNEYSDIDLLTVLSNEFFKKHGDKEISKFVIDFYKLSKQEKFYHKYKFHSLQILSLSLAELDRFRTLFYDIALDGIILYDPRGVGSNLIKKYQKEIEKKNIKRIFINRNDFYWKRKNVKFGETVEL